MRIHSQLRLLLGAVACFSAAAMAQPSNAQGALYALDAQGQLPVIVHEDQATMRLAAGLLGRDLTALSGLTAATGTGLDACASRCIVVGTAESALVQEAAKTLGVNLAPLKGQQERYLRVAGQAKGGAGRQVLLIAGADPRGAVYGVVDLTRELGISPWEWWADVAPQRRSSLVVDGRTRLSAAPSVAFRGIFINDEDWGLQPWAAKTFDPAKDIGPATYARVFELLWRLKANLVWPAMHPSTQAFYKIPGNAQMAADYAIVVGTSHAEPMMRNNVGEWDKKEYGQFNVFNNRDSVLRYWQKRIDETRHFENVYTLGVRGVHDSAMEGVRDAAHGRDTVAEIVGVQRQMLAKSLNRPPQRIPQVLTLYKEVLDYYNQGLVPPDDVTLVWPDDNYGYIHQLSNAKERRRSGGSGIYYHASYWGRPHDYLWLGTTHPALIRDQLQRAWTMEARRMWVVNVGDIKPLEYLTEYFLDAAFDANVLKETPAQHLQRWSSRQFGEAHGAEVAAIMEGFYRLAWERRPEFMGWSQTEPTRPNRSTDYVRTGGNEAEQRLEQYRRLTERAEALSQRLPAALRDAYFQLVLYPVRSAANLNTRILKLDLANEYARQQRPSANLYVQQAKAAHAGIVADTATYNALANGKWAHFMDMAPRRLPVFDEPVYPSWTTSAKRGCGVVYPNPLSPEGDRLTLRQGQPDSRTVTLVSYGERPVAWAVREGGRGLRVESTSGELNGSNGYEARITLHYDGSARPALSFQCGERVVNLNVRADAAGTAGVPGERELIVVLPGGAASSPDWEVQPGLGASGQAVRARLDLPSRKAQAPGTIRPLEYRFATRADGAAQIRLVGVPVHGLTSDSRLRMGVSLDGEAMQVFDTTTIGRSEEWKENVLTNTTVRSLNLARLKPGVHTLRVYALDPGVVLDRVEVHLDGAPRYYGMPQSQ